MNGELELSVFHDTGGLEDDGSLFVSVTTMLDDELLSWEFAATEPLTVLDGTEAFITRAELRSINVAFAHPDAKSFVRVGELAADTQQLTYTFGRDDLIGIIESIELREPTSEELSRD